MSALDPQYPAANAAFIPGFVVRVEMFGANYAEYDALHERMADLGLYRTVVSDHGQLFHMPPAEYFGHLAMSCVGVRDWVQVYANSVRPGSQVLVTEASNVAWTLKVA